MPIIIRYIAVEINRQALALLEDLVQRGIVHRGQDFCRSGQSLGSLHHKLPFLLLAGTQTVAEHLPLHVQLTRRFTFPQRDLLGIKLPVLDKGKTDIHAFSIGCFVGILQTGECVVQLQHVVFDTPGLAVDIDQDISIAARGTVVEDSRLRCIELRLLFVNEIGFEDRQASVVFGEKQELFASILHITLLLTIGSLGRKLQTIRSGRQLLPIVQHKTFARRESPFFHQSPSRLIRIRLPVKAVCTLNVHELRIIVPHTESGSQSIFLTQISHKPAAELV